MATNLPLSDDGPLVIQFWDGEEPPERIVELLASFPLHNPSLRHRVFSDSSADAFISEHFSRCEVEAFRACAQPTSRSDYLRYCAGFVLGGFCIDADVRCVGAIDTLFARSERGTVFGQRDRPAAWIAQIAGWPYAVGPYRTLVNGAFAFAQPGDPLLELAIEVATANIENRVGEGARGAWVTTGPGVFTSVYLLDQLGSPDAFLRYTEGTVLEQSAPLFCEVVERRPTTGRLLDGLDMLPVEEVDTWVRHVGIPRSAEGVSHWSRPEGSLFR